VGGPLTPLMTQQWCQSTGSTKGTIEAAGPFAEKPATAVALWILVSQFIYAMYNLAFALDIGGTMESEHWMIIL